MNKKLTSLLLALALLLSVGMVSALADEETTPAEENAAAAEETAGATDAAEDAAETAGETDAAEETPAVDEAPVIEIEEATPNMIMFADLEKLIKKNSPAYGALQANAAAIEEAQEQLEDLQDALVQIEAGLATIDEQLANINSLPEDEQLEFQQAKETLLSRKASLLQRQAQVQSGISGLSVLAGQDSTQLETSSKQFIMGCQSAYITLAGLKLDEASLERQLASMDRMLAALRVRADGNQISKLQMMEAENGREALAAGLASLRMNMTNLRMQLEYMLGEEITGTADVGALPRVTAEELAAIDLEKDLKQFLRRSASVQAAEDQRDATDMPGLSGKLGEYLSDAGDYAVENAELQAEVQFRSLYAQLLDYRQAVVAAEAALATEQLTYDAAALKYERGSISHNELLDAEDALQTAKESVIDAENTLFSTYNQYNWAVKYGILS